MTSLIARPSLAAVYDCLHYAIKTCRKYLGMRPESDSVTVCGMLGQELDYMVIVACTCNISV